MLATSSSDDEDYDTPNKNAIKKPPTINTSNVNNAKSPFLTGPKLNNNNNYSQPATPNISNRNNSNASNNYNNSLNSTTNAIQNVNLTNGGDTYSVHSSFSVSSENISLNNFNNGNNRNRNNLQQQQQNASFKNSSFKSNSSTSTLGQNAAGGAYPPQTPNLNTPRTKPRNPNQAKPRSGSRRPGGGDNASYASSNMNGDYDSDNSDYNYDSHYANQQQQQQQNPYQYQNSDDEDNNNENEDENDNENYDNSSSIVSSNNNRSYNSKNKNNSNKISEEEQQAALLLAQQNEAIKELENHKKRLQIYVFVCRCVAYPFIAKQPTDMVRRQLKISKQQLQTIKDNFESFLNNKITNIEADEAFTNAVRSYYEVFLKSDRVNKIVLAGGCTSGDFRDVFKNNIEKRVRSLPEIDGLSKETVLTSWMNKYDSIFRHNEEHNATNIIANRRHSRNLNHPSNPLSSECILTKEQLYDLFQNILGIKKFEHQLIFNAAQVLINLYNNSFYKFFNNFAILSWIMLTNKQLQFDVS